MAGIFEDLAREWEDGVTAAEDWFTRRHGASQAPPVTAATVRTTTTTGEPMSLADDLRDLAGKIEPLGEETITKVAAVLGHPETAPLLATLSQLAGVGLPVGLISEVAGGLTGLAKAYAPQQQAAA